MQMMVNNAKFLLIIAPREELSKEKTSAIGEIFRAANCPLWIALFE